MALGRAAWTEARKRIFELLSADNSTLRDNAGMINEPETHILNFLLQIFVPKLSFLVPPSA